MMVRCVLHAIVAIAVLVLAAGNFPNEARAQSADDLVSLNTQVSELYGQGKYAEAISIAEQYVALARQKHGDNHTEYATAITMLARVYLVQGRYPEAEPLFKRALALTEKALGPDHPNVGTLLNNLAVLYESQGRYGEAEPLHKRALAIREKALDPDHPDIGASLNNLAELYRALGRIAEAEPLHKRALAIREKALGPDHPDIGASLNNLAELYRALGRTAEAEPLYKRALALTEKALGPDHPNVGTSLNNLALLYQTQGRYAEAEPLLKRALAIDEKALDVEHPSVATPLTNLATLYEFQGRYAEAEQLFKRALAIRELMLGPDHPDIADTLSHLANLSTIEDHSGPALAYQRRATAIRIRRAAAYSDRRDGAKSELTRSADDFRFHVVAADRAAVSQFRIEGGAITLDNVWAPAAVVRADGVDPDGAAAKAGLNAGDIIVRIDGQRIETLKDMQRLVQPDRELTFEVSRGGVRIELKVTPYRREVFDRNGQRVTVGVIGIRLGPLWPEKVGGGRSKFVSETFAMAQWAFQTDAADALAKMSARFAAGQGVLAKTVRARQDLVDLLYAADKRLIAATRKADVKGAQFVGKEIADIEAQLEALDLQLAKDFPDYAQLARPKPLDIGATQLELRADEALLAFMPSIGEMFAWVVTKTTADWFKLSLTPNEIAAHVAALRCGLDYAETWSTPGTRCAELLKISYTEADHAHGKPLPFDRDRAYALYKALFGQMEDVIKDKHLLIVPSGALTQLPFQVLVTKKPDTAASGNAAFRRAAWLIRTHALTVLPSVSSLKALRQLAKDSYAERAMIGFGNPLLNGQDARDAKWASAARSKQSCPKTPRQGVAVPTGARRGVLPLDLRRGLADVTQIRVQMPLPETADELCAVARDLRGNDKDVWLGTRATEAEIKRLSEAGELAKYRIIHFATHGAMAGQLGGNSEPGLILTPPDTATERDDGYLSASEIAQLKLDADWVILSACNTAAGGAEGAEALSGLARAFFYAGARALLVSHWAVASDATVMLITGAVKRMASDKKMGRAEAMRQSMLAMIDNGKRYEAHPAFWAPFGVVGEGGGYSSAAHAGELLSPTKVQARPKTKPTHAD
jgi:CHAT domain-containing protein/tetratricopeptide (TPR) repeat protein